MKPLPHTRSCFVCGESNPAGLRLRFETDGSVVRTQFTPRTEHIGFKGVVHGGLLATLLDEIMVWACAVKTGRFAFCGELKVRYMKPVQPGDELVATAEMITNRRGKLFEARGELKNRAGEILTEGSGKYLPIAEARLTEWAGDFVGDPGWIFDQARPASA